jgi:hypothetical protein
MAEMVKKKRTKKQAAFLLLMTLEKKGLCMVSRFLLELSPLQGFCMLDNTGEVTEGRQRRRPQVSGDRHDGVNKQERQLQRLCASPL